MALFTFNKKKEEKKAHSCCCSATVCGEISDCNGDQPMDMVCRVKVLGAGCKNCHALYTAVKETVKNLDLEVEVEYITDMEKIMEYGVMSMPVLVVNDKIVSVGKVLKTHEIELILRG